jgi:hypothetical protein
VGETGWEVIAAPQKGKETPENHCETTLIRSAGSVVAHLLRAAEGQREI